MITINTNPDSFSAAYRPINFAMTSDKYADTSLTSVAITDNGSGKCRFTKASHGLSTGDLVVVSDSLYSAYEKTHEITVINSGVFDSDVDYTYNDTVDVDRNNTGFQIKAEFYHFNGSRFSITGVADFGGGVITVTTSSDHGFITGDIISIEETDDYNDAYEVLAVATSTSFRVTSTFVSTQTGYTRKGEIIGTKRQTVGSSFIFDVSGICQSVLSGDLQALSGTTPRIVTLNDNTIIHYAVLFTEQHDDIDGILQDFDSTLSSQYKAVNATLQHEETQSLDAFLVTTASSRTKRFLKPELNTYKCKEGKFLQFAFIYNGNDQIKVRVGKHYTSPLPTINDDSAAKQVVGGVGIAIVEMPSSTIYTTIHLINSSNSQISEQIIIYPDSDCNTDGIKVWWMNRKGGFSTYEFVGLSTAKASSEVEIFEKKLQTGFSLTDRGKQVLSVGNEKSYTVFGRFETQTNLEFLEELYSSPDVYIEQDSNLIPIIVTDTNNDIADKEDIIQPILQYIKANKPIIQR